MKHKPSRCDVCATPYFERNNYFYGKQFTVRDLIQEQSYFNEKRHLVNRMVLGWGVVCGLDVRWDSKKREFVVGTGMALDCCGREIIICEPQRVVFEDYDNQCRAAQDKPDHECKFVLCLEYDDCNAEPVTLPPVGCDDQERTEYNRVRDGFKLSIRKWDDACPKQPYDRVACLNRFKHDADAQGDSRNCETETIHHYLCRHLKKGCPECEGCDCVVLGTILVKAASPGYEQQPPRGYEQQSAMGYEPQPPTGYEPQPPKGYEPQPPTGYEPQPPKGYEPQPPKGYEPQPPKGYEPQPPKGYEPQPPKGYEPQPPGYEPGGYEQGQPVKVWIDTCTDRRFVYSNSLLYDLIYCHHGDLPHIVDFSWREHTYPQRKVDFDTFLQMMKKGLTVYFDQEMTEATLNPNTFIVSYLYRETGTGTYIAKRIPVEEIYSGPEGNCFAATFKAQDVWLTGELDRPDSELRADLRYESGVGIEILLRGSRIWSTQGKGLDGDYLADKLPTGNGTQGGDFVDWFQVVPTDVKKPSGKPYKDF